VIRSPAAGPSGTIGRVRPVEIACDESGSEGENLLGGETDVFAHAGIRMSWPYATACVREIRARIASDDLNGRGDPGLTTLLRSFVDAGSVWAGPGHPTTAGG